MLTLRRQFWMAIAFGIVLFGLAPIWGHETYCSLHGHQPVEAHKPAASNASDPSQFQNVVVFPGALYSSQPSPRSEQHDAEKSDKVEHPWLCDIGLTDIALVLFTYCLVVVGWATMRSNEDTLRDIEAPRFAMGWANAQVGDGRFVATVVLVNHGRSMATVKEWYVGFLPDDPVGKRLRYPRGIPHRFGRMHGAVKSDSNADLGVVWGDIRAAPVIIAYVKYQDIFKRWHVARYCQRMKSPLIEFEPAGHPAWSEDT